MKFFIVLISVLSVNFISLDDALEKAGYSPITLGKNLFGEYIINADINGKDFELMVTLEIDQTFIDKNLADNYKFDITLIENRDFELNNDVGEMYAVKVKDISLSGIESNEKEIGAIDFNKFSYLQQLRIEGILGKSFLKKHGAILDIATEKLYLRK